MRRIVSIALLTSAVALAGCSSSPARDSHLASFCQGYIKKGLGEYPIEDVDRNAMWLSWNEVVQETLIDGELDQPSYEKGRATFSEQMAANNVPAMQSTIAGDCDQGENHLWRWW